MCLYVTKLQIILWNKWLVFDLKISTTFQELWYERHNISEILNKLCLLHQRFYSTIVRMMKNWKPNSIYTVHNTKIQVLEEKYNNYDTQDTIFYEGTYVFFTPRIFPILEKIHSLRKVYCIQQINDWNSTSLGS